jgi:CSLREA domain-containing protein
VTTSSATAEHFECQRWHSAHSRRLLTPVLVLAALLCLLGGATAARAAEYTVNSTGDQVDESPGTGGCKTAVNSCTLRAAIEESNASTGVTDTIKFDFSSFDGQIADTIELGSSLPTITDSVKVGGLPFVPCETDYFGLPGPCVGIDGPAGGTAFRVAAKEVVINSLAISGAKTGVEAIGALGMRLYNDWLGLKLDGSAGSVETGVFLDQGSDVATIGGVGSQARDIFAHADVGLDIDGADAAWVRGSGFGVMPDGATPAPNGTNIQIADAATGDNRVANGNWIGWTLEGEELASPLCDGGCNVIAGATDAGINLAGNGSDEKPATGSTRIFGNYIGLNAFGTAGIPNVLQGVHVGSAENVTIGGPRPGDRNLINGGEEGILAGTNAENLAVEGNWVGLGATGASTLDPPTTAGIAVEGGYQVGISENRISMASGTAIEMAEGEAVIRSNAIGEGVGGQDLPGGSIGVYLPGACFQCGFVYGNSIANASHFGVLIEGSRNRVYGNRIEGGGGAGIQIKEPGLFGATTRNVIGGDTPAEENTISENGGAAIEINHVTEFGLNTRNEVARNHGKLNGGPFIDLLGGANGGILPPVFVSSTQSGASGSGALAGATIRVFRKTSSSPGELGGFLAEAAVDEAGNWDVTYPAPVAVGTIIAATQTRLIEGTATPEPADGTSELASSITTAEPEEPNNGGGGGGGGGKVIPQPPASDTTPPQTVILTGPPRKSPARTAKFKFISNKPGSSFECKLDRGPRRPCRSPMTLRRLWLGKHVFKIWAVDVSGNKDESPAKMVFRVLRKGRRGGT